jgi:hypothetical protein
MLTELQKFDYLAILLTDKISTIDSWPEGAVPALYITCTQDVGAGVGNAAGCITRRKHSASGTATDEGSSQM